MELNFSDWKAKIHDRVDNSFTGEHRYTRLFFDCLVPGASHKLCGSLTNFKDVVVNIDKWKHTAFFIDNITEVMCNTDRQTEYINKAGDQVIESIRDNTKEGKYMVLIQMYPKIQSIDYYNGVIVVIDTLYGVTKVEE